MSWGEARSSFTAASRAPNHLVLAGECSSRKPQGVDLGRRAEPLERQYFNALGRVALSHIRNMSTVSLCCGISTWGSYEAQTKEKLAETWLITTDDYEYIATRTPSPPP